MTLPIEDYGLIGNLRTAALVGRNGAIDWFCPERFDAPSVFAALLDDNKGGRFQIAPEDDEATLKQFYWPDTNILVTRFLGAAGTLQIVDYMPLGVPERRWDSVADPPGEGRARKADPARALPTGLQIRPRSARDRDRRAGRGLSHGQSRAGPLRAGAPPHGGRRGGGPLHRPRRRHANLQPPAPRPGRGRVPAAAGSEHKKPLLKQTAAYWRPGWPSPRIPAAGARWSIVARWR